LDNPCNFANPFQFEITFECLQELEEGKECLSLVSLFLRTFWSGFTTSVMLLCIVSKFCALFRLHCHFFCDTDLEWKVIYVGSAHDTAQDQVLDEILVGPVPVGVNKFVLQADAPDPSALPPNEVLGVTVVLVTCSYREREFVRVGYYVNNAYTAPLAEDEEPPSFPNLDMSLVQRQILADKPRVTKFPIQWGAADETTSTLGDGNEENNQNTMTTSTPPAAPWASSSTDPMEQKMAAAMQGKAVTPMEMD
jgi:histone chaperone ASF1